MHTIEIVLGMALFIAYGIIAIHCILERGRTPWAVVLAHFIIALGYLLKLSLSLTPVLLWYLHNS